MPTSKDTQKDTQKSLQKDLVKDIAKRANTLSLQDIQEGWQLAGAIADRQAALQKELQGYKDEILASQATLKSLRTKVAEYKNSLATLESKERQARQELAKLHDEISIQTSSKNPSSPTKSSKNRASRFYLAALKVWKSTSKTDQSPKPSPRKSFLAKMCIKNTASLLKKTTH